MSKSKEKKPIIGIIGGTSQFGQWFKFFFNKACCECLVSGRKTKLTTKELAKKADIVIVSVPVTETTKVIREVRGLLKPSALLCDFTSLKAEALKEMMKRKKGGVLGMHPLFGPLVSTMEGQIIVFCEGRSNKWVSFMKKVFTDNNAKVICLKAREHDKQMAMIQAMTHFINIVFARVLQKQKIAPQNVFATPVFRLQAILMGRVLGANLPLYASFQTENKEYKKVLGDFIREANKLSDKIFDNDLKYVSKEFIATAKGMKNFIPIAQAKATEIMYALDEQPIEIRRQKKIIKEMNVRGLKVACLGPEGTYSHVATTKIFSPKTELIMAPTIRQVFEIVENNEARFGIVPAENLIAGVVQETLDLLMDYPLKVMGSHKMDINHCLLARTDKWDEVKIIKSHPQPLSQCREWLSRNFPKAVLSTQSSSTDAILSTMDPSIAFIGSKEAAEKYKLKTLACNIEDNKNNFTEFYLLSRNSNRSLDKILKPKRTIMIITVYDRPGILRDVLDSFAKQKLNLTKLHSRFSSVKRWDYYFFLEIDCLPGDKRFKEAKKEINDYCSIVRVLGVV